MIQQVLEDFIYNSLLMMKKKLIEIDEFDDRL